MLEKIYYDNFTNEYVKEINLYAPPERYIPTVKNVTDSYIEEWSIDDGSGMEKRLDIAYNPDEYYDSTIHITTVKYMCEKHHCKLIQLHRFYIPPEKFDEYVEKFNLKK